MPQKACERVFCHVTTFVFFSEIPQNPQINIFIFFSPFEINVLSPRNVPLSIPRNL